MKKSELIKNCLISKQKNSFFFFYIVLSFLYRKNRYKNFSSLTLMYFQIKKKSLPQKIPESFQIIPNRVRFLFTKFSNFYSHIHSLIVLVKINLSNSHLSASYFSPLFSFVKTSWEGEEDDEEEEEEVIGYESMEVWNCKFL